MNAVIIEDRLYERVLITEPNGEHKICDIYRKQPELCHRLNCKPSEVYKYRGKVKELTLEKDE